MEEDTLVVHEIFASIQGESSFAGLPCGFVRLTGCDLRCVWCDTPQAFFAGRRMARSDVLAALLALGTPLVEVTGGEPLLQPGALSLMRELCDAGRTVLLETSGARDISAVDARVHRIVDLKPPGSGESHRVLWSNVERLTKRDEVKFVLLDRADYEWMRDVIARHALARRAGAIIASCVFGKLQPDALARWILDDCVPVRLGLPLHKYVWGSDAKGV